MDPNSLHMNFTFEWNDERPDKKTAPAAWNKSWESDLRQYYSGLNSGYFPPPKASPFLQKLMQLSEQDMQFAVLRETRVLCKLQKDIRQFALPKLAADGLEESWYALDSQRRDDVILQALCKSVGDSIDMEFYRTWCPEMTVENLGKEKGRYFIDLLKDIITEDPDVTDAQVVHVPNPIVEHCMWGDPSYEACGKVFDRRVRLNRTTLISLVVWYILLTLFNIESPIYIGKPPRHHTAKTIAIAKQIGGDECARGVKRALKHSSKREVNVQQVDVCWYCERDLSRLPPGTQLKACTKCKGIGRTILYCSKECQKEDWKTGIPRPHKEICGRLISDDPETSSDTKPESPSLLSLMIPNPDPNFRRSPALLHQIQKLKENLDVDYMIFQGAPAPDDVGIRIPLEMRSLRLKFLMLRRRAFQSGDRTAVNEMFDVLRGFLCIGGLSVSDAVSQLSKEYGVSVTIHPRQRTERAPDFVAEELKWAHNYLDALQSQGVPI